MRARSLLPLYAILALGCGDPDGDGTIEITAYGEAYIEEGIPASEVADGWAIQFQRFEVHLQDVTIGEARLDSPPVVDLSRSSSGAGHRIGSVVAKAGEHRDPGFSMTRIEIVGQASKGERTKTFHWLFDEPIRYSGCETVVQVRDGGSATFQITIHADHLFADSLVAGELNLLFGPLAEADLDEDGTITKEELAATGIGAYDPGSEGGIDDLWSWLVAQAGTLGHVDGEGHCHTTASTF